MIKSYIEINDKKMEIVSFGRTEFDYVILVNDRANYLYRLYYKNITEDKSWIEMLHSNIYAVVFREYNKNTLTNLGIIPITNVELKKGIINHNKKIYKDDKLKLQKIKEEIENVAYCIFDTHSEEFIILK